MTDDRLEEIAREEWATAYSVPSDTGFDPEAAAQRIATRYAAEKVAEMIGFMRWDLGDRRGFPKRWDEAWSVVEHDWRDPDFMREQMARYREMCAQYEHEHPEEGAPRG